MELTLVTATDCHLCEHSRSVLDRVGADWRELHDLSPEGERLTRSAPPLRPLLFDDHGSVVAYGRLSERWLRRELDRERVRG